MSKITKELKCCVCGKIYKRKDFFKKHIEKCLPEYDSADEICEASSNSFQSFEKLKIDTNKIGNSSSKINDEEKLNIIIKQLQEIKIEFEVLKNKVNVLEERSNVSFEMIHDLNQNEEKTIESKNFKITASGRKEEESEKDKISNSRKKVVSYVFMRDAQTQVSPKQFKNF